jgi:hypothetical protein
MVFLRENGQVEVRTTTCPHDEKMSLKVDETPIGQKHEDEERK